MIGVSFIAKEERMSSKENQGRSPVYAKNMVSTSHPLSVQAGLNVLRNGGNAVDAAIATAICQTVVEPTMNGIGGDAFALVWDGNKLSSWNGSGKSPQHWTPELFSQFKEMPQRGWASVTVPGCVKLWADLSSTFGKLPFDQLFHDAIRYAEDGFHIPKKIFTDWNGIPAVVKAHELYQQSRFSTCAPKMEGDFFSHPEQAKTLKDIAKTNGDSFYSGDIAKRIALTGANDRFALREGDLEDHKSERETPLSASFCGFDIHEIQPNGQGFMVLEILRILENLSIDRYKWDSWEYHHLLIEAVKLAFADATQYLADPKYMEYRAEDFFSKPYTEARASLISMQNVLTPSYGVPIDGGTIYLTTADSNGMMVSFIQSNFMGFGSGIVIPETGISMHNRGAGFTLDHSKANCVGPGKRPFHTILPAFITKDGQPFASFGVMGGTFQAQGQSQLIIQMLCANTCPQSAIEYPRWRVAPDYVVEFERSFPKSIVEKLQSLGHKTRFMDESRFGGAQLIKKTDNGYLGASDPRKDGHAAGY